jgi:hypothetical protein
MRISGRIRSALAALALASTVVTTLVNPISALAAQSDPNHPSPNMPHPTPTPAHRFDPKPLLPDVSVHTVGHSGDFNAPDYLVVAFEVKTANVDANNVPLVSQCTYRKSYDTSQIRYEKKIGGMSLYANWPVPIPYTVTCAPHYDEFVSSVYLNADMGAGDANPYNNIDTWDYITNK